MNKHEFLPLLGDILKKKTSFSKNEGRRKKKHSSVLYRFGQTDAKLKCSYLQVS